MNPRIAALVAKTLGVDMHNHIDVPLVTADVPGLDLDLAGELKRSGLSAVCATFAVDYQRLGQPSLAYERFQNALTSLDAQLARNKVRRALNLPDLQAAHDQGQPTVIQAVEGDHVGIGTDTKLTPGSNPWGGKPGGPPPGQPMDRDRPGKGPGEFGAPGGGPNGPGGGPGGGRRPGDRTNQVWPDQSVGFYYAVVSEMVKQGFTDEEITKVGGGNFCRVFGQATASRS